MMHRSGDGGMPAIIRSRRFLRVARLLAGGAVLVAIVLRVGTGPFVHGLLSIDAGTVVAAVLLAALATAAAAWRWQIVARRLGAELRWSTAVGMYYQSQFLNTVLPGGVLGDVQRAVDHGRAAGRAGAAARAVVVERTAGQLVQLAVAVVVLAVVGVEFEAPLLPAIGAVLAVLGAATIGSAAASTRVRRALAREATALRAVLGSTAVSAQIVAASIIVVCCHVATFAIATAAVGANVPPARIIVLAVVVLLAASIPVNIGGWGPREGAAGWAFAVAGFGAAAGVSAATLFGILAIIAVAPGVILTRLAPLITRRIHRDRLPVRDRQLRDLPRRIPRHRLAAEARPLEPGGLRPGG